MGTDLSGLEERIANTHAGAITSIQAVYVPADDLTDPAAVHVFSHLSASIVLRATASEGLYPAIDLLQSIQKWPRPASLATGNYNLAQEIRRIWRSTNPSRILWPCLAWNSFPWKIGTPCKGSPAGTLPDAALLHYRAIQRNESKLVSLKDSLDGANAFSTTSSRTTRRAHSI